MRVTFLDEAGTSNKAHEPYLVVAGVIVDPDRDYAGIERTLRHLADRCFPDGEGLPDTATAYGKPFVFHAKDIWHGSGFFPRDKWPLATRMELLRELSEIPWKFGLTVVYGAIDRQEHADLARQRGLSTKKQIEADAHAAAFLGAMRCVDRWMVENAHRERTIAFAEDRRDVKEYIETVHALYTNRAIDDAPDEVFLSSHIVEPIAFVKKERSPLLQIADHCAFIIKRRIQGCPQIAPYFSNVDRVIWEKSSPGDALYIEIPASHVRLIEDEEGAAPPRPKRRKRKGADDKGG